MEDRIKLWEDPSEFSFSAIYIALTNKINNNYWSCNLCKKEIKAGDFFGMTLLDNPEEHFVCCFNCIVKDKDYYNTAYRYFGEGLECLLNPNLKHLQQQRNKLNRQIATLKKANLKTKCAICKNLTKDYAVMNETILLRAKRYELIPNDIEIKENNNVNCCRDCFMKM